MISVGLIGCGDVAEYGHLPTILQHADFRLVATCDLNRQRAELLATRAGGVPYYTDWRKLLASEQLDAVVLALPPEVSPVVVEECLRRNLAVLDEKPLAATLIDGRRLARLVGERDCVYQVGFVLRYGDWVQEIQRVSATLGSPRHIHVEIYDERLDPSNETHFSRIQSFLKNSSALTHEGSHVVDYVSLWNASPWTSVSAFAQQTLPTFSGPNVWNAQVNFEDLSSLHIKVAWLLPELPPSTIRVVGPAGRLSFNCVTGEGEYETEDEERRLKLEPLAPQWKRQYDTFAHAIKSGRVECATVGDALHALEVTAACELSAQLGSSVNRIEFQRHDDVKHVEGKHPSPTPPFHTRTVGADSATDA